MTRSRLTAATLLAGLTVASLSFALPGQAPAPSKPSLYDRLGGLYNIAAVVDSFIEKLVVNPTLSANPAIHAARKPERLPGLKVHVSTLVCEVTGGPCKYSGRDMKSSHAALNISEKDWEAMVGDFKKTLDEFKVPAAEQEELIGIVATTKPDIVMTSR